MKVGYGRISDKGQHLAPQLDRLAFCDEVFYDKKSGRDRDRVALNAMLTFVRKGDTVVCTRLDRLARSVKHLCDIAETLQAKEVDLLVLDQNIDTSTPTGKLLFHILAAIAEFELSLRKDQQAAGIAAAHAAGVQFGRLPVLRPDQAAQLRAMKADGYRVPDLARYFRIKPSTVYKYLKEGTAPAQP